MFCIPAKQPYVGANWSWRKLKIRIAGVKKIILRLQELELLTREGSKKLAIGLLKYTVIVDYKVDFNLVFIACKGWIGPLFSSRPRTFFAP